MSRSTRQLLLRILTIALVACALVAVGCGDDDDGGSASAPATEAETTGGGGSPEDGLPDLDGVTISYLGFGGSLDEAFKKAWFDPFSEATGAEIVLDSPTDFTKIKSQVESGNVTYDIIDGEPFFIEPDCGTLFEELDVDLSAVEAAFQPTTKCVVPETIYHSQIVYQNESYPDGGPDDCEKFFDTENYPGKRGLFSYAEAGILDCASIAAGADPKNPYPIDLDAAFDILNRIKDDVVIYESATESQDMLENGDIDACICLARATAPAINGGADLTAVFEPTFRQWGAFAVPKGAPQKEAAEALLNYIMTPEVNERAQQYLIYGLPTGADPTLAEDDVEDYVSTGEKVTAGAVEIDLQWWIDNADEVFERWGEYTIK